MMISQFQSIKKKTQQKQLETRWKRAMKFANVIIVHGINVDKALERYAPSQAKASQAMRIARQIFY